MEKCTDKKKFSLMLIVLTLYLMLAGQSVLGASETVIEEVVDFAVLQDTCGMVLPEAPSVSMYSMRRLAGWSHGAQLESANEQAMYQALVNVEDMTAYYYYSNSNKNGILLDLSGSPYICPGTLSTYQKSSVYQQLVRDYTKATHAYVRDYGMEYWISHFAVGVLGSYKTALNSVVIDSVVFYPVDYYSGIRDELGITDGALMDAIQSVGEANSRYQKVKAAHDYVIELVTYNSANVDEKYGHTITGGLLEKYNHLGVCECYAKLFRLLCTENGIPCILVTGGDERDVNGDVIADHMWNYVQMNDGLWYLVDTTWDDQPSVIYTYFLAGSESEGFNNKRVGNDHLPVGCFSSDVFYDEFVIPALATEAYEREIPVTEILLEKNKLKVHIYHTADVTVSGYLPDNANAGKDVTYTSSDSTVATVSQTGTVTAKKPGTTTIIVTSKDFSSIKAVCEVEVEGHRYGEWKTVQAASCTKAEEQIRSCGCGVTETQTGAGAKGHIAGEWIITKQATGKETGEKVQKCTAEGCGQVLKEATIAKTFVELNVSGTIPLRKKKSTTAIKIASQTVGDKVEKWTSSKPSVAKVDPKTGKITASKKKTGKATITVTMESGAKDSVVIKVQGNKVKTKKLAVQKELKTAKYAVRLKVKDTFTIKATKTPITSEESITFTSSKKKVAAVGKKNGKITAKKAGKATITVKSGKKTIKIKVTVTK